MSSSRCWIDSSVTDQVTRASRVCVLQSRPRVCCCAVILPLVSACRITSAMHVCSVKVAEIRSLPIVNRCHWILVEFWLQLKCVLQNIQLYFGIGPISDFFTATALKGWHSLGNILKLFSCSDKILTSNKQNKKVYDKLCIAWCNTACVVLELILKVLPR